MPWSKVAQEVEVVEKDVYTGKGVILVGSAAATPTAVTVGTNGKILRANSATATGVEWSDEQTPGVGIPDSLGVTKGDIAVYDGTDWIRVGIGSDGQVLTASSSQPSGARWSDPASGTPGSTSLSLASETISGTSYTLIAADVYKKKRTTNSSAVTVTVPLNATVPISVGQWLELYQAGTGQITVAYAVGVVINSYGGSLSSLGAKTGLRLHKVDTNEWDLEGALA